MDAKEAAARKAVEYVRDGMIVGLGSGTTATFAIQALGEKMRTEGLQVRGVPTSSRTDALAENLGIPLVELTDLAEIDLTIDGADEVDPALHLIKGGGGALVREKLVASASRAVIIICDSSKIKTMLGAYPLPVAVVPFGWRTTRDRLLKYCGNITLRQTQGQDQPFLTDDGNYILDLHLGRILDAPGLEAHLKQITGVVEVGLFVNLTSRLILGFEDGHTEERLP